MRKYIHKLNIDTLQINQVKILIFKELGEQEEKVKENVSDYTVRKLIINLMNILNQKC